MTGKPYLLLFLLLFTAGITQAKQEGLLWEIQSADGRQHGYLFGTIHIICEEDYIWTPAMQQALEKSSQVCFEMNLADPDLMNEVSLQLMDFSGKTLRDYFRSAQDFDIVASFIRDSLHQDLSVAGHMKPVGLYFLYSTFSIQSPCKGSVKSYEMSILEAAQQKKLPVQGLESVSDQLEAMATIPTDSIIAEMVRIARGEEQHTDEMEQLIKAYKQQDLSLLQELMEKSEQQSGLNMRALVDDRNKKWIAPIKQQIAEKTTFFAVGAGHLKGLIRLLQQDGYQVRVVPM